MLRSHTGCSKIRDPCGRPQHDDQRDVRRDSSFAGWLRALGRLHNDLGNLVVRRRDVNGDCGSVIDPLEHKYASAMELEPGQRVRPAADVSGGRGADCFWPVYVPGHKELSAGIPVHAISDLGSVSVRQARSCDSFNGAVRNRDSRHTTRPRSLLRIGTKNESLLLLQACLGIVATMTMALAVMSKERRDAEEQIRNLAITDPLTGIGGKLSKTD